MKTRNKILVSLFSFALLAGSITPAICAYSVTNPKTVDFAIGAARSDKTYYLNGGGSSLWNKADAWFAAYVFDGGEATFIKMTETQEDNYYSVSIPGAYKQVIFCRMDTTKTALDWDSCWNQTADLQIPDIYDTYTITGFGTGEEPKSTGEWSAHTHSYGAYEFDSESHWKTCKICGVKSSLGAHTGGTETEEHGKICDVCNHQYTDPLPHSHDFTGDWCSDETGHWKECTKCGEVDEVVKHTYVDDVCSVCGFEDPTPYYVINIYNGNSLVSVNKMAVNSTNDKEMFVTGVAMQKGYKAKAHITKTETYFGTSTSYEHNLTAAPSVLNGYVTETGDYVACQNGTFDFYVKFNDSEHTSYSSTYVQCNNTKTFKIYLNWNDVNGSSMYLHYWGDDVIGTDWNNRPHLIKESDKVYYAIIPAASSSFKLVYNKTTGEYVECSDTTIGNNSFFEFDNWNNGTPTMKVHS